MTPKQQMKAQQNAMKAQQKAQKNAFKQQQQAQAAAAQAAQAGQFAQPLPGAYGAPAALPYGTGNQAVNSLASKYGVPMFMLI